MSEKTKKGRTGKRPFADPARVHEQENAKPPPAADLKNWKAEAEAKAEKGLLTMAAMGVFLFL